MPTYKVTYFPFRGRAEVIRMLLKLAGQDFEDIVVEFSDWAQLKPSKTNKTNKTDLNIGLLCMLW